MPPSLYYFTIKKHIMKQGKHRTDQRYTFHNWKEQVYLGEVTTIVDIVDTATGQVVDKLYIQGNTSWTKSGKSLTYYDL